MPYFSWSGISLQGTLHKGTAYAQSKDALDELLFKKQIALMHAQESRFNLVHYIPVRLAHILGVWQELAALLTAGIALPHACSLVAEQTSNKRLQKIMYESAEQLHAGNALSAIMSHYPMLADSIVVQLLYAGEQSGSLIQALHAIVGYKESKHAFYNRLRIALALPIATGLFFLGITFIIITMVVPRFAEMFVSLGHEVPAQTAFLLKWGNWLLSMQCIYAIIALFFLLLVFRRLGKKGRGKYFHDYCILSLPGIGMIIKRRFIASTMHSLGLLLNGGLALVPALHILSATTRNDLLRAYLTMLAERVSMGYSLSQIIADYNPRSLFSPQSIAMIRIGQETGTLGAMLVHGAQAYYNQVNQMLTQVTLIAQPLLMIILGLLVTALLFSLYIPIFTLSSGF